MPQMDAAYRRRDRAESFGSVADLYDRYRPSYPDELVDDLVVLAGGGPVLDIGTGTGKAARLLAARGIDVLGVEVDVLMAEVARRHGLAVEVGSFEAWGDRGRRFRLVTSAQAWHWVDPRLGAPKVARALEPGGAFTPFWNFEEIGDAERDAASEAYREFAPELLPVNAGAGGSDKPQERPYVRDLRAADAFASIETRTYRWQKSYPVEHWVNRVATHSDHIALGPERLARLQEALGRALSAVGPEVHACGGTYLILARAGG